MQDNLNEGGWLYIATDLLKPNRWKVGKTSNKDVFSRIRSTENTDYFLVRGYAIPSGCDVGEVEDYIHWRLERRYSRRIKHSRTQKKSEWFEGDLKELISTLERYLRNILKRLLRDLGRENEYVLIDGDDEDGIPFEELIYDQKIYTANNLSITISGYANNPYIQDYINHSMSILRMPFYTMVEICANNLNQCEETSISAYGQYFYDCWLQKQGSNHNQEQCRIALNHFIEEERKSRSNKMRVIQI